VPAGRLAAVLAPRHLVVAEELVTREPVPGAAGATVHRFVQAVGPLAAYERTVTVEGGTASGLVRVRQDVRFRVGVPYVSWIFALPLRSHLGSLEEPGRVPWWAPPARMAHDAAVLLATLCALAVLAGYLDGLLPATMTYAGREFGVGNAGQGVALGVVQVSAVMALALLARADRRGRRRLVLLGTVAGAAVTAAGAVMPSLAALTATQVVAGALLTAQFVLLGIMAVEGMPAGSRAWGIGLITMCYGLGGGITLLALPLAGVGRGGWRWLYALALLALPAAASCARHLRESRRWQAEPDPGPAATGAAGWSPRSRRRLLVLGAGALLFALFSTPAGQFQNQYLRTERHWTALRIGVVEQVAGTVGGLGTLVGARLADTRGRRPVLAVALGAGTAVSVLEYFAHGAALYGWMTAGSFLGYAVTPALAVYGAELFPTRLRGAAGGVLTILAAGGGLLGLTATGFLAGAFGSIGPGLALLAAGPLLVILIVLVAYPETAGRRLEELNPGDARLPEGA